MRLKRFGLRSALVVALPTDMASAGVLGGPGVYGVSVVPLEELSETGEGQTVAAESGGELEDEGRVRERASRFGFDRLRCFTAGSVGGDEFREEDDRGELIVELRLGGEGGMLIMSRGGDVKRSIGESSAT